MSLMNRSGRLATLAALVTIGAACSAEKEKEDPPPTIVYGTMTLADSKAETDNGAFQLTTSDACKYDVNSGRVDVIASQGAGKPALALAIKGFVSTPKVYTCTQAVDNVDSETAVGGKFDGCMVEARVLSGAAATSLNTYSMYRETVATKTFAYAGACTIDVTSATGSIKGTVTCTDLVQTMLGGTPRNPILAEVNADVTADFNCTFR